MNISIENIRIADDLRRSDPNVTSLQWTGRIIMSDYIVCGENTMRIAKLVSFILVW